MRGITEAAGARWSATIEHGRRPSLASRIRRRQGRSAEGQLELIDRVRREQWRELRSGEYVPEPGWERRWR